jgi:hypothetical protein
MGMDEMGDPTKHGPQAQPMFERAPGLFHPLQLRITQGEIGRCETLVVALDHTLAAETGCRPWLRGVNPQPPT